MSKDAVPPRFSTPQIVELEAQVAAQRARLAATVDELTTALSPRVQAARALDRAKRLLRDSVDPDADPKARRRARLALGGTAAVAAVLVTATVRGRHAAQR